VSLLQLYLHAKVKEHPTRFECIFTPCRIRGYCEKRHK